MAMEYLRIYLLGGRSVGKSALVVRYLTQKFVADCSQETVVYEIEGRLKNGRTIHLEICDVAEKDLNSISIEANHPGVTVFALVFSIAERLTFYHLKFLLQATKQARKCLAARLAIIGCKLDLECIREVDQSSAALLAKSLDASYHECSARNGEGAFAAFDRIINDEILEKKSEQFATPCLERNFARGSMRRAVKRARNWIKNRSELQDN